jgi:hypothetical protein
MRNGQNKRMRGRNRNKGHHGGHHHHHHHHNPLTRVYESNGPDVKIRGTPHHVAEKYLQLARDAQASGDPVTAENHYQHAEHYFRLIAAAQEQFRQQNPYYQPQGQQQAEGNRDESFEEGDEDTGQSTQTQQPNFGNQQQPFVPREQPQPYQQQLHNRHQQQPQHQPYQAGSQPAQQYQQPQQPQQQQQQQQQQFQPQPDTPEISDGERLPSFVTRTQTQAAPQNFNQGNNNYDNQGGGDRFPRHRRRRHRGGGPRSDMANASPDLHRDEGPDDSRPQ